MRKGRIPEVDDEALVLLALLGDLPAYDELVRRYRGAVLAVAQHELRSRELAEDAAQDALLLAFKALPQLEHPSQFAAWLGAITRHRARRMAQRASRDEPTEASELDQLILAHSEELGRSPVEDLERRFRIRSIAAALEQVPAEYQTVLRLRYFEEWPVAQIADFLSLPVTTVKWRLHQGRRAVRRQLEQATEENTHECTGSEPRRLAPHPPCAA